MTMQPIHLYNFRVEKSLLKMTGKSISLSLFSSQTLHSKVTAAAEVDFSYTSFFPFCQIRIRSFFHPASLIPLHRNIKAAHPIPPDSYNIGILLYGEPWIMVFQFSTICRYIFGLKPMNERTNEKKWK